MRVHSLLEKCENFDKKLYDFWTMSWNVPDQGITERHELADSSHQINHTERPARLEISTGTIHNLLMSTRRTVTHKLVA